MHVAYCMITGLTQDLLCSTPQSQTRIQKGPCRAATLLVGVGRGVWGGALALIPKPVEAPAPSVPGQGDTAVVKRLRG